jgi:uncharacterized membrane protein YkvI
MKSILKVVFVVIGTIIGAGFASGQEIWLFFNQYGNWGAVGMLVSCYISGLIIYRVFHVVEKTKVTSYDELLKRISTHKIFNRAISIIISLFLLISFYIMVAGMSALFHQEFGFPTWICSIFMAIFCYLILQKDMKGIMVVNSILIPCLILFILYLGTKNITFTTLYFQTTTLDNANFGQWIFSSILYASYNSIMLIPMLVELKPYITSKKKAKQTGIICAIILSLLGISLFSLLLRGNENIYQLELPMIEIVKVFGGMYCYFYIGVVITAIFTTAISAGYGFLKNQVNRKQLSKGNIIKREKQYYQKILLAICVSAPFVANIGFSNLVSKLYPMFGILGLIQIIFLFKIK